MIKKDVFYTSIRPMFGGSLSAEQVTGMDAIFGAWERYGDNDMRKLGAVFGNVKRETGSKMVPVREGFKTSDAEARAYVKRQKYAYAVIDRNGQMAYGRGPLQLTWPDNYEKADRELGLNGSLIKNYDRALEPDIGARIAVRGMMEGWFSADKKTKQRLKLSTFFSATVTDWAHHRRIVNGMDHADEVATFGKQFYAALLLAYDTANAPVQPVPPPEAPPKSMTTSPINWAGGIAAGTAAITVAKNGIDAATGVAKQAQDAVTSASGLGSTLSGLWSSIANPWTMAALGAVGVAAGVVVIVRRIKMAREQGV